MYNCPACGAIDVEGRETCACGADLSLLARLEAVSDAWFNEGLRVLSEGARGRALEWFSAACAARPTDAAARRAQAKVWAQLGRWDEAREALERAALIEPDADELNTLRQAIEEGAARLAAQTPPVQQPSRRRPARVNGNTARRKKQRGGVRKKGG
jgi:tetratricopeptide (TPR) repeat protein